MQHGRIGAFVGLLFVYLTTALSPCIRLEPVRGVRPIALSLPVSTAPAVLHEAQLIAAAPDCHEPEVSDKTGSLVGDHDAHSLGTHQNPSEVEHAATAAHRDGLVGVRAPCLCGCDKAGGPEATPLAWHTPSPLEMTDPSEKGREKTDAHVQFLSRGERPPTPVPLPS